MKRQHTNNGWLSPAPQVFSTFRVVPFRVQRLHLLLLSLALSDFCTAAPAPPLPALKVTPGPVLAHGGRVRSVAFSPDSKKVAIGSDDGTSRVWDATTGKPITPPIKDTFPVRLLSFSPDGKAILLGAGPNAGPGRMRVHDAATGRALTPLMMDVADDASGTIWDAAFSPDGKLLLAACTDGARLYDATTGQQVGRSLAHTLGVMPVAFHPGGKVAATASRAGRSAEHGEVRLWTVATGKQLGPTLELDGEVHALAFSPDGKLLLTAGARYTTGKGVIRLWDAATGKPVGKPWDHPQALQRVAFRPDGKEVLGVTVKHPRKGVAVIWDVASGKQRQVFAHPDSGWVNRASWSPDGKWVVSVGGTLDTEVGPGGHLRVWDTATGRPLCDFVKLPDEVKALGVSADGRSIVTGCEDRKARLWAIEFSPPSK